MKPWMWLGLFGGAVTFSFGMLLGIEVIFVLPFAIAALILMSAFGYFECSLPYFKMPYQKSAESQEQEH